MYCHWKAKVAIFKEVPKPLLRCDQCGMHMHAARILKHRQTDKCNKAMKRKIRRQDVDMSERCENM